MRLSVRWSCGRRVVDEIERSSGDGVALRLQIVAVLSHHVFEAFKGIRRLESRESLGPRLNVLRVLEDLLSDDGGAYAAFCYSVTPSGATEVPEV